MSRLLALSLVAGLVGLSSGCATCCAPYDCDYISQAGRWARHNPSSGRVGSAFDEAGGPIDATQVSATEELPPAQPTPAQPVQGQPLPQQMYRPSPGMPGPSSSRVVPGTRSVIPRNMGQNYLPRGE
jgi:hypothetical protein